MGNPVALEARAELRRYAWVHLDYVELAGLRMNGKLNIRAAGFNADRPDNLNGGIAHYLIFLVAERLSRSDRNAVAGVNSHRVEVFYRADDNNVIFSVPHHLQLEFLPADDRFLDKNLVFGT